MRYVCLDHIFTGDCYASSAAADFEGGLMTSWMTHLDPGVGIVGYPENVERVQIF